MRYIKSLVFVSLLFLLTTGFGPLGGGGSGSGGGTTITSGTGDFSACTQSAAALNCTVTKSAGNLFTGTVFGAALDLSTYAGVLGSSTTGSPTLTGTNFVAASVPNAALVTAPLTAASTLDATKLNNGAWAAPGAIGGTTPAAGTFTALNATSAPVLGAVGGTTSSTGQFTKISSGTSVPALPTNVGDVAVGALLSFPHALATDCFQLAGYAICAPSGASRLTLNAPTSGAIVFSDQNTGEDAHVNGADGLKATIGLTIASDTVKMQSMARMPLNFSVDQQTALVANEHMGTYLTSKAITIENATVDETNVTCATPAVVTCFDCGTAAGACTASQTSTIWTSPNITTANTGLSVAGGSITTASVATAHYITCEVTAGTCATLQAVVSLMARPQ